ncbi:hypothetical protein [Paludisphaera rhizosphaerae]|uniref:hypothetical protein n=1 Tax=Paludisphaera rhizosphaerae TaxID=2711216 RepID=UPI0013EDFF92|nr:hypothetical protein [Paludisphaera rhizosphaerae]
MGCDIHCCIEYASRPSSDDSLWDYTPFAWEINLGRDYDLFALLAGVRGRDGVVPVCEPKGLPEDVSTAFLLHSSYKIDDELAALEVDGYCSREEAEQWVQEGSSLSVGETAVTNPDWHSISWLNVAELQEVQRRYRLLHDADHLKLSAVIAAMGALDNQQGGRSRLVFWFKG